MNICVVGVNHKTAPLAIRGKIGISSHRLQEALLLLHNYVSAGIILSTCNRLEVYALADSSDLVNFLSARADLSCSELLPYTYTYHNEEAIKHLFKTASGLDSMIIGEFEILGQVRRALEEAEKTHPLSLLLLNLFRQAVRVGRRVRHETGISRSALSVSSVAVDLATRVIGNIGYSQVLVIGTGEAGRLAAKAIRERGSSQITVAGRSEERASTLAAMLGGRSIPMNNLKYELSISDIVISCTGAPHAILKAPIVEEAMSARPKRPLVIIDIAVPKDVEPEVKQIGNVFLYDLDDLTHVSELNTQQRQSELTNAMEIVDEEVERFASWWQALEAKSNISALVEKAENIRQSQLTLTLKKLPRLSDEERANIETMTMSMMQKILHEPIQYLKKNKEGSQIINELFGLKK
jgi:glutamyl-tRNA reductase